MGPQPFFWSHLPHHGLRALSPKGTFGKEPPVAPQWTLGDFDPHCSKVGDRARPQKREGRPGSELESISDTLDQALF